MLWGREYSGPAADSAAAVTAVEDPTSVDAGGRSCEPAKLDGREGACRLNSPSEELKLPLPLLVLNKTTTPHAATLCCW